jgi:hypothetical protein
MRFTAHRDRLHRTKQREFDNACRFYSRPKKFNDSIVLSCHLNSFVERVGLRLNEMAAACTGAS